MEENNHLVDYGICCGTVKNGSGKIFTKPHFYTDKNQHGYSSDGLCHECLAITEKFRAQRKISKLEET